MKFRCVKNNLEKISQGAENFLGKDLDLKVLSCVLLECKDNFLKIEATNIETSFYAEIPVLMEKEGKVAVDGEVFYKTINALKDEDVLLEAKDNILKIKSKNSEIKINTLNNEDFPTILKLKDQDEKDLEQKFKINSKDFLEGLNAVNYAASKSNIKPELSSIFIKTKADKIYFVATDGYRLAEKSFKFDNNSNEEFSILLPGNSVPQIIKSLMILDNQDLEIYFFKNQFFLKSKEFVIFSRLVDGEYVEYKKLIPEDVNTSVIVLKQDFLDSLKIINVFADDFNQLKISIKDKKIKMENKNSAGDNEIKIEAKVVGEDIESKFNYKYIQDSFVAIKTDSLEFIFNPGKPLLIVPVGDKSFRYLAMPLSR